MKLGRAIIRREPAETEIEEGHGNHHIKFSLIEIVRRRYDPGNLTQGTNLTVYFHLSVFEGIRNLISEFYQSM